MKKLKEYLKENGHTYQWFSTQMGLTHQYISIWMCGKRRIPVKYWKRIIALTHKKVTLKDFMEEYYGK